jgi:hypothetical protein
MRPRTRSELSPATISISAAMSAPNPKAATVSGTSSTVS